MPARVLSLGARAAGVCFKRRAAADGDDGDDDGDDAEVEKMPERAVVLNVVVPSANRPRARRAVACGVIASPAVAVAYRVRARLRQQQR